MRHRRAPGNLLVLIAAIPLLNGLAAGAEAPSPLPRGHVFFQADFDAADALKGWTGAGKLEPGASGQVLAIERTAGGVVGGTAVTLKLPAEAMRGYAVGCTAKVKAENVSDRPQPWNGLKFMLAIEGPGGKTWPQAKVETGTFDWRRAAFTARIPADATSVTLCLGLEAVTGRAWFDDVRIAVAKPPFVVKPRPAGGPVYKGHDLPRLRGTMVSPDINEASLRVLGKDWNANVLRWQLVRYMPPGKSPLASEYDGWLEGELKKLDAALPLCEKYGLYVVVDLHSPPGGSPTVSRYVGSDAGLFADKAAQAKFVEVWQKMARRYKGAKPVWGFDLANEPVEDFVEEGCDDWHDLAERAAKAVRAIDPDRTIIVEPPDWGNPAGIREFAPIDVPGVVYSVHMYVPHEFTHQGVFADTKPVNYPGEIGGKTWDKAALAATLQPVVAFQKAYGVHIYLGEFSAIRWAPDGSAARYLKDLIDIFEANGWDWTYHAFREWQGWSVEHGSDKADTKPAAQPTDRQKLLCDWFAKNRKPAWQKPLP